MSNKFTNRYMISTDDRFIAHDLERGIQLNHVQTVSTLNRLNRKINYMIDGDTNNFGAILMQYSKTCNDLHTEYEKTINLIRQTLQEYIEDCDESMTVAEEDEDMLNSYGAFYAKQQLETLIGEIETRIFQKSRYINEKEEYLWWKDSD